ncbi:ABC transporter ATP-binding protein [Streptomyces sp. CRN 30]|uniref:ABC transporter ATP-binding protein n=1 Tax=Streptomyces sp. CRN 30 TaxID=3075613 RepID=UPI002A819FE3|nr:ATP-binding cassette domain-containing protein [Streptomyces sp. CRN 30]
MSHRPGRDRHWTTGLPDAPAAEVTGLTVTAADGRHLVRGAWLELRPGRLVALTGPSGSGKTTLLRALTGLLPPGTTRTAGHVEVLGHDVLALPERELRALRRDRLAHVGQDPASGLNPRMRVRSLVRELAPDRGTGRGADPVADLLAQVRLGDEDRLSARRPGALSGGQQRRVALARALARRPAVLLLDEPTAGLHPGLRDEIGDLLRHLAREHRLAVAFSCHDAALVARIADEVVELGAAPRRFAAARPAAPVREAPTGPPLLDVRDVSVTFRRGTVPVLHGVGLTVPPGAAVGVVGASGCGKTTLVRAVVGLQPVTTGTVLLDGVPLRAGPRGRDREQRRRVQFVTQNPLGALNPSRTVGDTVGRPLRLHRRRPPDRVAARVTELLDQVGLGPEYAGRYPHELSGGQRQRVSIARALAAEPDVLICDEVTSALDGGTAEAIMDLLGGLRTRHALALVLISHDLPLVADRTDTVTVLDAGRVVESGRTAQVFAAPAHPATAALLARTATG